VENFTLPKYGVLHHASAEKFIDALVKEIRGLEASAPENHILVVTIVTPDGRMMSVEAIKAVGFGGFLAHGRIGSLSSTVMGHINTLHFSCAYEESKGRHNIGFRVEPPASVDVEFDS
jgi:hypothetical protein